MHLAGPWSGLFHFFDRFSGELRDITLFHELLNKRGKRFDLLIGHAVAPDAAAQPSPEELIKDGDAAAAGAAAEAVAVQASADSGAPSIAVTPISTPASGEPELPSTMAILPSRVAVLYPGMLLPFRHVRGSLRSVLLDTRGGRGPQRRPEARDGDVADRAIRRRIDGRDMGPHQPGGATRGP